MEDLGSSLVLLWTVVSILLRFNGLIYVYLKRKEVPLAPSVVLVLFSPVLGFTALSLFIALGDHMKKRIVVRTAVYVGMIVASQLAAGFLMAEVVLISGGNIPGGRAQGPAAHPDLFEPYTLLLAVSLSFLLILALLYVFDPKRSLLFFFRGKLKPAPMMIGVVGVIAVSVIGSALIGLFDRSEGPVSTIWGGEVRGPFEIISLLIAIVILAPLMEELLFRGYIFGDLEERLGRNPAILMTAVLFAIFHLDPFTVIPIFMMGLILGWVRARSGSLLPSLLAHSANNLIGLVYVLLD